jgi:hypothetical protein
VHNFFEEIMEYTYDEDLNENQFFQVLQSEQPELFQQATLEGWVICVPRAGSLPKYTLTDEDFYNHILIPSDELPESHFRTLTDKEVRVCNRIITVENEAAKPFNINILFEETFYNDDMFKYKVLCVECPLEPKSSSNNPSDLGLTNLQSLRDCIDLLWTESMGKEVMQQLDQAAIAFKESHSDLENESLQTQRDLVNGLYIHCVQITMKDPILKGKTISNKHLLSNIKIAVETYMHHGIYKILIKGITASTATEDAQINKIIRNCSELQLKDLEVRCDLFDTVPAAKQELAHIDGYSTVLGKSGCIKRALAAISGEQIVCADDLLPVLVFLVIKVSLPNWIAHLTMMRNFRFCTTEHDELSFLVTSLEAAIEHVKSGCIFRPLCPEAQFAEVENSVNDSDLTTLEYLFNKIKHGNIDGVRDIIDKKIESPRFIENIPSLCHPLCSCDKCEDLIKQRSNVHPTPHSYDEKGFTALHVACKYGQLATVELLLERNANINVKDLCGSTPLHHAASRGHQNVLLFLLHKNAHPDVADTDGNTPLHVSSSNGHEACVKALLYFSEHLGQPLKVEARNVHGDTPLHHASRWGYLGIVQILLEYGARPDLKNNRRISPIDCAHSIHVSKLLSTLMIPSKKGPHKKFSFPKVRIAATSKSRLDFEETSIIANKAVNISNAEEIYEYGVRPRSLDQCKKVGYRNKNKFDRAKCKHFMRSERAAAITRSAQTVTAKTTYVYSLVYKLAAAYLLCVFI